MHIRPLVLDTACQVAHALVSVVQLGETLFPLYLNASSGAIIEILGEVFLADETC